jgi:hypothetical protein
MEWWESRELSEESQEFIEGFEGWVEEDVITEAFLAARRKTCGWSMFWSPTESVRLPNGNPVYVREPAPPPPGHEVQCLHREATYLELPWADQDGYIKALHVIGFPKVAAWLANKYRRPKVARELIRECRENAREHDERMRKNPEVAEKLKRERKFLSN